MKLGMGFEGASKGFQRPAKQGFAPTMRFQRWFGCMKWHAIRSPTNLKPMTYAQRAFSARLIQCLKTLYFRILRQIRHCFNLKTGRKKPSKPFEAP